ncbi:MAG: hypothetical protein A49_09050 [Methyloceanibacter sp.]|nr:MAG: hypothetical protein A49_09050 [Methyloceanibacter sp.]
MNTDDPRNREPSPVRPTGYFGLGGMGCLVAAWLAALTFRKDRGCGTVLPLIRLCLDLDHGSANLARRLSAVDPLRSNDGAELHLLPDHSMRDLRQALEHDPATRIYARRMNDVGGTRRSRARAARRSWGSLQHWQIGTPSITAWHRRSSSSATLFESRMRCNAVPE